MMACVLNRSMAGAWLVGCEERAVGYKASLSTKDMCQNGRTFDMFLIRATRGSSERLSDATKVYHPHRLALKI